MRKGLVNKKQKRKIRNKLWNLWLSGSEWLEKEREKKEKEENEISAGQQWISDITKGTEKKERERIKE